MTELDADELLVSVEDDYFLDGNLRLYLTHSEVRRIIYSAMLQYV